MTTGLWLAASRISADVLIAAVPPACRRTVAQMERPPRERAGDEVLVEAPEWPVDAAVHLVPSFAALTTAPYSVRLELRARLGGAWTPWVAGVGLGPASFPPLPAADDLDVDVDVVRTRAAADAVRLRLRVPAAEADAVLAAPWVLALSAADASPAASGPSPTGSLARLDVPRLSQMAADPAIARRICSPTCVAMVLDFWGRPAPLASLAREMFHPGTDLYGVWPAAIRAAGRRGLAGYLLRFPDWASAAWCLDRGLPLIVSVRYTAGELTGAAVPETAGHLLILTGYEGEHVLVNDPGAAGDGDVARRYRLDELTRVWLGRAGVGYVIFPASPPLRGG
jgi:hypothetical protein